MSGNRGSAGILAFARKGVAGHHSFVRRLSISLAMLTASCGFIPGTMAHRDAEARKLLTPVLLDAESARFDALVEVQAGKSKERLLCGRLNAKNQLGAYVGLRRFVIAPADKFSVVEPGAELGATPEERESQRVFDKSWPEECAAAMRN